MVYGFVLTGVLLVAASLWGTKYYLLHPQPAPVEAEWGSTLEPGADLGTGGTTPRPGKTSRPGKTPRPGRTTRRPSKFRPPPFKIPPSLFSDLPDEQLIEEVPELIFPGAEPTLAPGVTVAPGATIKEPESHLPEAPGTSGELEDMDYDAGNMSWIFQESEEVTVQPEDVPTVIPVPGSWDIEYDPFLPFQYKDPDHLWAKMISEIRAIASWPVKKLFASHIH